MYRLRSLPGRESIELRAEVGVLFFSNFVKLNGAIFSMQKKLLICFVIYKDSRHKHFNAPHLLGTSILWSTPRDEVGS
jgi:hypothetical protein